MDGRGIGKSKNQDSVDRLSQALSSNTDHRCNAVSKVYTSTTVTLSLCHASQSHGLPAERGREGRAWDGPAMCTGQREPLWTCTSRVVYVCRPASLPPVLRPRSRSGSPPVSRYPLALCPILPPCPDHPPSTSFHGLCSPMTWQTQHTALRPLRVTTEHIPSPGPSSPITTRIILSPLPSIIHLSRFLHSRCHHLSLISCRPFP